MKCIGYVEQNGYIYSRSLDDNILLGRPFDQARWGKIISLFELQEFSQKAPGREELMLKKNGYFISGGER